MIKKIEAIRNIMIMTMSILWAYSYTGILEGSIFGFDSQTIMVFSLFLIVFLMKLAENLKAKEIKEIT